MDSLVLRKAMDRVQADMFIGTNDAFLAPIMCQLKFNWRDDIRTAQISVKELDWNPDWFLGLPEGTRKTVLAHELWHLARLHPLRREGRNPKEWNWACDIEINNMLEKAGYSFDGTRPWINRDLDDMPAEDIYDLLVQGKIPPPSGDSWTDTPGEGDMGEEDEPISSIDAQVLIEIVAYANAVAKIAGKKVDPMTAELLNQFLKPKIDWRNMFHALLRPYKAKKLTWAHRNRRYSAIMPSRKGRIKQMGHIVFFIDISGSISTKQAQRFVTEVRRVKELYDPEKITIVQFDTEIQVVDEFKKNQKLDKLQIVGRGGTSLECVSEWIAEHKPEMAVVFSDMFCDPMDEPKNTKMVFIVQDNKSFSSFGFGTTIHVQD